MRQFVLPDLGEVLEEAEIVTWYVNEGDHIVTDQPLLSVETDKAVLDQRVTDSVIRRMIDKWLKAGVLEDGLLRHATEGSPQGGVISPCLSNIFLHHVLDEWFETEARPRLKGGCTLVRFADDAVMAFENFLDAKRVLGVLRAVPAEGDVLGAQCIGSSGADSRDPAATTTCASQRNRLMLPEMP